MTEEELYLYNEDVVDNFEEVLYNNTNKILKDGIDTLSTLVENEGGSLGEEYDPLKAYVVGDIVSNSNKDILICNQDGTGTDISDPTYWTMLETVTLEDGVVGLNATGVVYLRLSNTKNPSVMLYNISSINRIDEHTIEVFIHPDAGITDSNYMIYHLADKVSSAGTAYSSVYDKTSFSFKVNLTISNVNPTEASSNYIRLYFAIIK